MGKKIWIFNQFAGDSISGWGERHLSIGKYLVKSGFEVTIFSGSYTHMFKNNRSGKVNFESSSEDGVNFIWVKSPVYKGESIMRFFGMFVFMFRLFFIPVKKFGKPDVVMVSSMPIFPVLPALFLKWRHRIPKFIFEIRDFWPATPILLGKVGKFNPLIFFMGIIQKIGFEKADKIISVPSNPYDYIKSIIGSNDKVCHIPNGAFPASIVHNISVETKLILSKVPIGKFIVGYAGTIGLANSLHILLDAARLLKDNENIQFVLLGEGYLKSRLINDYSDLTNVTWLDRVPKNQVSHFINLIDVGVICWHDSPLYSLGVSPNKYFDYMSNAKPIIISGGDLYDPAIESGCAFVALPGDANSLASIVLTSFNSNRDILDSMGENGRRYFLENHTFEVLANKYHRLFL